MKKSCEEVFTEDRVTFVLKRVVSGIVLLDLVNGVVCSTECARGVLSYNVIVVTGDVRDLV